MSKLAAEESTMRRKQRKEWRSGNERWKMPGIGARLRKGEKTSAQWLCGLSLGRKLTTQPHTHSHTHGPSHWPFCQCTVQSLLCDNGRNKSWLSKCWEIYQFLTDLFIALPCSLVVLCNSSNETQMLEISCQIERKKLSSHRKTTYWSSSNKFLPFLSESSLGPVFICYLLLP